MWRAAFLLGKIGGRLRRVILEFTAVSDPEKLQEQQRWRMPGNPCDFLLVGRELNLTGSLPKRGQYGVTFSIEGTYYNGCVPRKNC